MNKTVRMDREEEGPTAEEGIFAQLTFDGTAECDAFVPNPFKKDICRECMSKITAHTRSAVRREADVKAAIEWLSKRPSVVLARGEVAPSGRDGGGGGGEHPLGVLLLGGFKAAMDARLLKELSVTHIVNAAVGLGEMWPQWEAAVARNREAGVSILELPWCDTLGQQLEPADLRRAAAFIAEARAAGGATLVHCAQGRSRSTVAVVAHLVVAAGGGLSVDDAVAFVQERRIMAQPNPAFMEQLRALEKAAAFVVPPPAE